MKKHIVFVILTDVIVSFLLSACNGNTITNPYVKEYMTSLGNIVGNVEKDFYIKIDDSFEIGASENGDAVFKNPDEAFETLKEMYSEGIKIIQLEFKLSKFNKKNYQEYKIYGWQVTAGSDEEKEQAQFVSKFLDIYENSFK